MSITKNTNDFMDKINLQHTISKRKDEFMKKYLFSDNETELLHDIKPDQAKFLEYVLKDNSDRSTACGSCYAEHEV